MAPIRFCSRPQYRRSDQKDLPAAGGRADHGRERDAVRGQEVPHRLQLAGPHDEGVVEAARQVISGATVPVKPFTRRA